MEPPPAAAPATPFELEGGWLCLGFCNTVAWHARAYQRLPAGGGLGEWEPAAGIAERFTSYRALIGWLLRKRQLSIGPAKRLLRAARREPAAAEQVRLRAIALRETIFHLFTAAAAGRPPHLADVAALNAWLPLAAAGRRLGYDPHQHTWRWSPSLTPTETDGDLLPLDSVLWPVVWSATELLTSDLLSRVRECANDPCGWLFVDHSRNHSRRWCDMRDCGNRVKARRHYQRTHHR